MTVELRPLGVNCNIACTYCYQNPQRDAGSAARGYDIDVMLAAVEREGGPFTLFGGEPLLVRVADLERLWAWGLERYGGNTVQTNGTLIDDEHLRLFRTYNVQVGISLDGPGELNDARTAGSPARTRAATARAEAAIDRLCQEGRPPSLIVTLHRGNAVAEHLPRMAEWFRRLDRLGVPAARLHLLEVEEDSVRDDLALSAGENVAALLYFAELEAELTTLRFDVFADMERLLRADDDEATCVWLACDPYTTEAVRGVEGDGATSNCGRTNKEGIGFTKSTTPGYERYLALYQTPQEHGGCRGCRFFVACKGQCPGTAIDGDWRNRTEHCAEWTALFTHIEQRVLDRGEVPVTVRQERPRIEGALLEAWATGSNPRLRQIVEALAGATAGPP